MAIVVNGKKVAGVGLPGKDGAPGADGKDGAPGKSAYQAAKEKGYTGTEEEFNTALAGMQSAPFLPLSGGTVEGVLEIRSGIEFGYGSNSIELSPSSASRLELVANDSGESSGGSIGGTVELIGLSAPTASNSAANKQYVDEQVEAYRAVKGTYPIAAGQSIQAGDVVDVVEGQLQKTVTAVPNVNTVVNKTTYAELQMVHLSKDINVQIYINSSGGTMYANILDDNGGIVLNGQNLGMDVENIAAARLDDTHFLVGFVLFSHFRVMVGTVSGKTISFGDSVEVDGAFDRYYTFAALPNGRVAVVYKAIIAGSSKLRVRVYTLSSSSLGSVYTRDVTGESQSYISAAAISEERVCICFADQNDSSKGKAVVAAINGANAVTWGTVVEFSVNAGDGTLCCAVGDKVIAAASTGAHTKAYLLRIAGNQISMLSNAIDIPGGGDGSLTALSNNQAVFLRSYSQGSPAVVLTVSENAMEMGEKFIFAKHAVKVPVIASISNSKLIAAYADTDNSNYGTVTLLTVSGNQIAGSFVDGSQDAIALQGGTAGQSIEVIYSGTVAADWVTEGQVISSPGVYGAGVLDGVLQVWSKYMPRGPQMVTGTFIGRQGSTSDLTNNIELGFRPQYIVVLSEASPNTRRIALPGLTYRWNANDISSNDGLTITDTGFLIANNTTNNNEKYHYVAFG